MLLRSYKVIIVGQYISENWICIYSMDETKKFKYGFSNEKKYKRIQLAYNENNLKFIDNYVRKKDL